MKLLPEELKCRLPPLSSQDEETEPTILARYALSGAVQQRYQFQWDTDSNRQQLYLV